MASRMQETQPTSFTRSPTLWAPNKGSFLNNALAISQMTLRGHT